MRLGNLRIYNREGAVRLEFTIDGGQNLCCQLTVKEADRLIILLMQHSVEAGRHNDKLASLGKELLAARLK